MKTKFLIPMAIMIFIAGSIFPSCKRSVEERQMDRATERVKEEKRDLQEAKATAEKEWLEFKHDAEDKIASNDSKISELKSKMKTVDIKKRDKFRKRVMELEKQNSDLRNRLSGYKYEESDNWQEFKREFNHDMQEMGNAIKDLFQDNIK